MERSLNYSLADVNFVHVGHKQDQWRVSRTDQTVFSKQLVIRQSISIEYNLISNEKIESDRIRTKNGNIFLLINEGVGSRAEAAIAAAAGPKELGRRLQRPEVVEAPPLDDLRRLLKRCFSILLISTDALSPICRGGGGRKIGRGELRHARRSSHGRLQTLAKEYRHILSLPLPLRHPLLPRGAETGERKTVARLERLTEAEMGCFVGL